MAVLMLGVPIGVGIQFAIVAFAGAAFAQIADESIGLGTTGRTHGNSAPDGSPDA